MRNENSGLKSTISSLKFSIENLCDKDVSFYRGFPTRAVFDAVLTFLNPGARVENVTINSDNNTDENQPNVNVKIGRPRKLSPANQLLMLFCRVRVGLF